MIPLHVETYALSYNLCMSERNGFKGQNHKTAMTTNHYRYRCTSFQINTFTNMSINMTMIATWICS